MENDKFDFDDLEKKVYKNLVEYSYGVNKLIDNVAIRVLAGHHWAKYRNFDTYFDQNEYYADSEYAKKQLITDYPGKTLQEILNRMINLQAEVIWLSRLKEGEEQSPYDYENDKWEAKRFIAYLFFQDIRYNCCQDGICPDLHLNLLSYEIVDLLKSLTLEEYCRINSYLRFIERNNREGKVIHGYDHYDYLHAVGDLDNVFLNCSYQRMKKINHNFNSILDKKEKVKTAKYNTCNRLGCVTPYTIEKFVDEYYSFVKQIINDQANKEKAINILKKLYDKSNSKIVNMMEFLLKCMVASYVEKDEHNKIRIEAGKKELDKIQKKLFQNSQKEPLF